jgi:hypothetical protein
MDGRRTRLNKPPEGWLPWTATMNLYAAPKIANADDDAFNGDGSLHLRNRFSNDMVRFLEAAGVTGRGM